MLNQQHTDWRASGTQFSHFGGGGGGGGGLLALNSHTSGATGMGARDTGATGMLPVVLVTGPGHNPCVCLIKPGSPVSP